MSLVYDTFPNRIERTNLIQHWDNLVNDLHLTIILEFSFCFHLNNPCLVSSQKILTNKLPVSFQRHKIAIIKEQLNDDSPHTAASSSGSRTIAMPHFQQLLASLQVR